MYRPQPCSRQESKSLENNEHYVYLTPSESSMTTKNKSFDKSVCLIAGKGTIRDLYD